MSADMEFEMIDPDTDKVMVLESETSFLSDSLTITKGRGDKGRRRRGEVKWWKFKEWGGE